MRRSVQSSASSLLRLGSSSAWSWLRDCRLNRLTSREGCALVLIIHAVLLGTSALVHSPAFHQVNQLPAGLSHWELGKFDLCQVNPPLARLVAAIPLQGFVVETDWSHYSDDPTKRAERAVGRDFVKANARTFLWLFFWARIACIPFSLIGGYVCGRWANDLYGPHSALAATVLWCSSPEILAHGSLIGTDVPAAALGVAAVMYYWRWRQKLTWKSSVFAGTILGAAELTKFTLLALYPAIIIAFLAERVHRACRPSVAKCVRATTDVYQFAILLVTSVVVINFGYAFDGSMRSLKDYRFHSQLFVATFSDHSKASETENRAAATMLELFPVPLPRCYVQGLDTHQLDFENGLMSYLRGEWKEHGWWYYYLVALCVKQPLGILGNSCLRDL